MEEINKENISKEMYTAISQAIEGWLITWKKFEKIYLISNLQALADIVTVILKYNSNGHFLVILQNNDIYDYILLDKMRDHINIISCDEDFAFRVEDYEDLRLPKDIILFQELGEYIGKVHNKKLELFQLGTCSANKADAAIINTPLFENINRHLMTITKDIISIDKMPHIKFDNCEICNNLFLKIKYVIVNSKLEVRIITNPRLLKDDPEYNEILIMVIDL